MAIDRRTFLLAGGAVLLAPAPGADAACHPDVFAAACREPSGAYSAIAYDETCGVTQRVILPGRGHDLVQRPGTRECVVFARRPGTFAVAFVAGGSRQPVHFSSRPDRHFFGHGVFSPNGRLLYTSENDFDEGRGMIGVRDATAGYRQIGEFPSGGIEPHDLCLLGDGRTLVIANGGIETHPASARENLNIATMEPSLAYVDIATGELLEEHRLPQSLHKLSIRHLALAQRDEVYFGCQYEGPITEHPPLIGFHRRGEPLHLIDAPDALYRPMKNYIGSVSADRNGEMVAATSPRGGLALVVDVATRRIITERSLSDVCGVAPRHAGASFLLTSGAGDVGTWSPNATDGVLHRENLSWDNHAILLDAV